MFNDIQNITFDYVGSVLAAQNLDFPLVKNDTHSYKISFSGAGTCNINFNQLTGHDDITLYIYRPPSFTNLTVSINAHDYAVETKPGWRRLVFNLSENVSKISIVSDGAINIFIDKIGSRKVSYSMEDDMVNDFVNQISISPNISTTLAANLSGRSIKITDDSKVTDVSRIKIGNDILQMSDYETIDTDSPNPHSLGDTVNLLCPTIKGDDKTLPNPCVAVAVYDESGLKERAVIHTEDGDVSGVRLPDIGIMVAVMSKIYFGQLKRQYSQKYGEDFYLYIDGEKRQVLSESFITNLDDDGNNSVSYFYRIKPPIFRDIAYYPINNRTINVASGVL